MNNLISLKARQTQKIAEIGEALRAAGMFTLAAQAKVLGLRRSTVHTIVRAQHKSTGISGRIIARMLRSPQLPTPARAVIEEYAREKMSGVYGNNKKQQRHFLSWLDAHRTTGTARG
jgi:hypothetical protein